MKSKTINSTTLLKKQLRNLEFKKEYDALRDEFEIAREVLRLRKEAKLTQQELAIKAGTSQPAIARLESGKYENVSLSFLRKVGKVLGAIPDIHFRKV